jgi:hypothetical protein
LRSFSTLVVASNLLLRLIAKRGSPMEMFLMVLALSLLGVAVSAVLFAAATRDVRPPDLRPDDRLLMLPSHFFVDDRAPGSRTAVPIEVLLLQIERHVRLEQAAAESFRDFPTVEALYTATRSPLVH